MKYLNKRFMVAMPGKNWPWDEFDTLIPCGHQKCDSSMPEKTIENVAAMNTKQCEESITFATKQRRP